MPNLYHVNFTNFGMITFILEYNIIKEKIVIVRHYKATEYVKKEGVTYIRDQDILEAVYNETKRNNIFNLY
jgi:hypothetical protein